MEGLYFGSHTPHSLEAKGPGFSSEPPRTIQDKPFTMSPAQSRPPVLGAETRSFLGVRCSDHHRLVSTGDPLLQKSIPIKEQT